MLKQNNLVLGIIYLLKGFADLKRKEIRPFVVIPLLISIIIFSSLFYFGFQLISDKISSLLDFDLPSWLHWLSWLLFAIKGILNIILFMMFFALFGFLSTLCANLIAAPFNGLLSEKLSVLLKHPPPTTSTLIEGLLRELRKIGYYVPRFILLGITVLILFFIPLANLLIPVVLYLFTAWMMAVEYLDFPADNIKLPFKDFLKRLKHHKMLAFSFGFGVTFLSAVPIINFIMMPAAVLGATRLWHDHLISDSDHNRIEK